MKVNLDKKLSTKQARGISSEERKELEKYIPRLRNIIKSPPWKRRNLLISLIFEAINLPKRVERETKRICKVEKYNTRAQIAGTVEFCFKKEDFWSHRKSRIQQKLAQLLQVLASNIYQNKKKLKKKYDYKPPQLTLNSERIVEEQVVDFFEENYKKLGFDEILNVNAFFPDATCLIDGEEVEVEIEVKSENFKWHGHDPDKCDYIVCWVDDWINSPPDNLTIVEIPRIVSFFDISN